MSGMYPSATVCCCHKLRHLICLCLTRRLFLLHELLPAKGKAAASLTSDETDMMVYTCKHTNWHLSVSLSHATYPLNMIITWNSNYGETFVVIRAEKYLFWTICTTIFLIHNPVKISLIKGCFKNKYKSNWPHASISLLRLRSLISSHLFF